MKNGSFSLTWKILHVKSFCLKNKVKVRCDFQKICQFHEFFLNHHKSELSSEHAQCGKTENSHWLKICFVKSTSVNKINFFSKTIAFTKFLLKNCERHNVWKLWIWERFRENNVLTKEVTNYLIWRLFFFIDSKFFIFPHCKREFLQFRETNFLVTSLVKVLLSRNFWQKFVRGFRQFPHFTPLSLSLQTSWWTSLIGRQFVLFLPSWHD